MGLDMYLNKMPRYKNTTVEQVRAIEEYFDWKKAAAEGSKYADCTFEEWCGIPQDKLPGMGLITYYKQFYKPEYSDWDIKHEHPWYRILEQVGYWRKANAIHNWFVEHIQNGEDDCKYHREVTEDDLIELLEACQTVLDKSVLKDGKLNNGESYSEETGWTTNYIDGKVIANPEVAEELLPSTSGFFFGSTEYDEWYLEDIKHTVKIIQKVLEETNFDTEAIYYVSSW